MPQIWLREGGHSKTVSHFFRDHPSCRKIFPGRDFKRFSISSIFSAAKVKAVQCFAKAAYQSSVYSMPP
jgi:hypothetical protein